MIQMILRTLIDILTVFFGNVVVWSGIAGVLLVVVVMISYRVRRRNAGRRLVGKDTSDDTDGIMAAPGRTVADSSSLRIALVTGASSGIGRMFAHEIDRKENGIDEIWLVARREDKLRELSGELQHPVRVIPEDLTRGLDQEVYENRLTQLLSAGNKADGACVGDEAKIRVGILVNAAGFARIGNYETVSFSDSMRMIDLNAKAAVAVTLTCLPYMQQQDRIIQMCSTAAFQPLQHINIYGASKSFLYHYTRALRLELLPRGIMVTAVCPFWVKDTEFIAIANASSGGKSAGKPPIRHFPFATTAKAVAHRGLRASRMGWAVVTPGVFCVIHRIFTKVLPREDAIWIWELMRRM